MRQYLQRIVLLLGILLAAMAAAQDSLNITRVGELLGVGYPRDVAFVDSFVYVADEIHGLVVYDVRDATLFRAIAMSPDNRASCVRIFGDRVYVGGAGGGRALEVWDISNRTHPVPLDGFANGSPLYRFDDIEVNDSLVYLFGPAINAAYRLADPANPVLIAIESSEDAIRNVEWIENGLWGISASGHWGHVIFSSSTQFWWHESDSLSDFYLWNFAPQDNIACFAAGTAGLLITSITNPQYPWRLAVLDVGAAAVDVTLSGDSALVTCADNHIAVVDITDPLAPVLRTRFALPVPPACVAVEGARLCMIGSDRGVRIMDISNPAIPTEIGYSIAPSTPWRLTLRDTLLFVADNEGNGLGIVSITDPAHPVQVNRPADSTFEGLVVQSDVALQGTYVYVMDERGVETYDIADITQPHRVGEVSLLPYWSSRLVLENSWLYVSSWNGLSIYNAAVPAQLALLGSYPFTLPPQALVLMDTVAYLAGGFGLTALSVANPAAPALMGQWPAYAATDVARAGRYMFLHSFDTGNTIPVLDLANPGQPVPVDTLILDNLSRSLRVYDHYLLATDATGSGLTVLDIQDPLNAVVVGFYHDSVGGAFDVAAGGDYVYVGTARGLVVYDATAIFHFNAAPEVSAPVITDFTLGECYPNPFNATTVIPFALPREMRVSLHVCDVLGREAAVLVDGARAAGEQHVSFEARGLASGIYFVRLEAAGITRTRKVMLIR